MTENSLSDPTRRWLQSGRFVECQGKKIFLYERGSGPTLLFLHGFPTSCYDWRGMIDLLSNRFRCIAFDFPGYGLSDKPEAYSYSLFQQADCVESLAHKLEVVRAHVISHDMGTSVHNELLARAREGRLVFAIRASTFTNGSMLQWRARTTPFQNMLASNDSLLKGMELCASGLPANIVALKSLMKRPEVWDGEHETVIRELLLYNDGHLRLPALAGYMRERYIHHKRWLGSMEWAGEAVQFVWGADDPIATIEMGREMHSMFPKAGYTELENVGHFIVAEAAESVARKVGSFDTEFK